MYFGVLARQNMGPRQKWAFQNTLCHPRFLVTTIACRPGSQYDVAATRGADSVVASDCCAQFGRLSTRRGCRICVQYGCWSDHRRDTVQSVLASKCDFPPFRYPLLNVPNHSRTGITEINFNILSWGRFGLGRVVWCLILESPFERMHAFGFLRVSAKNCRISVRTNLSGISKPMVFGENQTYTKLWLPFRVAFAPFPEGEFAVFLYRKTPCFIGKSYYFYRISCTNPLFRLRTPTVHKIVLSIKCIPPPDNVSLLRIF